MEGWYHLLVYLTKPNWLKISEFVMQIRSVRGTEDHFLTPSMQAFHRSVLAFIKKSGFLPLHTPILEKTELFARSLGESTDVVSKEMYTFERGSEGSICLRPEMTASTIRAYYEHNVNQLAWKSFQFGPVFRYERPQKGRLRQFHQYNLEVVNTTSYSQDIALISMLDRLFSSCGLTSPVLHLNYLGTSQDRAAHRTALKAYVEKIKQALCPTCLTRIETNLLRIFDCKNETCQKEYEQAPKLTDHLCEDSAKAWNDIQERLTLLSVSFIHNPYLVRGLDYYNGVVFEFSSELLGAQSAFCGGGRYDLGPSLSVPPLPSVGVGIGFERLMLVAEAEGKISSEPAMGGVALIPMEETHHRYTEQLVCHLQAEGISAHALFDGNSLKQKLKLAHQLSTKLVLIIGDTEVEHDQVTLKDMESGDQQLIATKDLAERIKNNSI